MSEIHPNWHILNDMGVTAEAHISGAWLRVDNLDKENAIKIGHALIWNLDILTSSTSYDSFTLARAKAEAEQKLEAGERTILGEMRPANRNCAVSIETGQGGSFQLKADIRNDFEDDPSLNGAKRMQLQFIETIEAMDFS